MHVAFAQAYSDEGKRAYVDHIDDANAVSSEMSQWTFRDPVTREVRSAVHRPVLDLDLPVAVHPSSTPGHHHLYIDCPMPWERYQALLSVLAEVGLLEQSFVNASIKRGYTTVRLPWVKKELPELQSVEDISAF